jgi:hypothetical protein
MNSQRAKIIFLEHEAARWRVATIGVVQETLYSTKMVKQGFSS